MFYPRIVGDLSFASWSTGRTDVCTNNKPIHCKQMQPKKIIEKKIDEKRIYERVRIGCP